MQKNPNWIKVKINIVYALTIIAETISFRWIEDNLLSPFIFKACSSFSCLSSNPFMWSKPLACWKYFQQFFKALQWDTFGYKNSFSSCSVYIVNSETNQPPDLPQFWVNKYINCNNNTQALQNRCIVYNKFNYS